MNYVDNNIAQQAEFNKNIDTNTSGIECLIYIIGNSILNLLHKMHLPSLHNTLYTYTLDITTVIDNINNSLVIVNVYKGIKIR